MTGECDKNCTLFERYNVVTSGTGIDSLMIMDLIQNKFQFPIYTHCTKFRFMILNLGFEL